MSRQWSRVGDAYAQAAMEKATVADAMSLIVKYREMREECLCHSACAGCPYFAPDKKKWEESHRELSACSRVSTDDVLDIAAAVFKRHQTV